MLIQFLLFVFVVFNLSADGLEIGYISKVISGKEFIYYETENKKKVTCEIVCVKAEPISTKKGKYQKKILEDSIKGKEYFGIIRGKKGKRILIDLIIDRRREKLPSSYRRWATDQKILKKSYEFPECWLDEQTPTEE